jgi:hypothetical protein
MAFRNPFGDGPLYAGYDKAHEAADGEIARAGFEDAEPMIPSGQARDHSSMPSGRCSKSILGVSINVWPGGQGNVARLIQTGAGTLTPDSHTRLLDYSRWLVINSRDRRSVLGRWCSLR